MPENSPKKGPPGGGLFSVGVGNNTPKGRPPPPGLGDQGPPPPPPRSWVTRRRIPPQVYGLGHFRGRQEKVLGVGSGRFELNEHENELQLQLMRAERHSNVRATTAQLLGNSKVAPI